jgi:hypothetical protein
MHRVDTDVLLEPFGVVDLVRGIGLQAVSVERVTVQSLVVGSAKAHRSAAPQLDHPEEILPPVVRGDQAYVGAVPSGVGLADVAHDEGPRTVAYQVRQRGADAPRDTDVENLPVHAVTLVLAGIEGPVVTGGHGDPVDAQRLPSTTTHAFPAATAMACSRLGAIAANILTPSRMYRYTVLTPTANPVARSV